MARNGRATISVNGKDNDVPEFNRDNVSLDIPDQLFSQSFSTLTNVSKIASRFIMVICHKSIYAYFFSNS